LDMLNFLIDNLFFISGGNERVQSIGYLKSASHLLHGFPNACPSHNYRLPNEAGRRLGNWYTISTTFRWSRQLAREE
jgi:hypothetical protein